MDEILFYLFGVAICYVILYSLYLEILLVLRVVDFSTLVGDWENPFWVHVQPHVLLLSILYLETSIVPGPNPSNWLCVFGSPVTVKVADPSHVHMARAVVQRSRWVPALLSLQRVRSRAAQGRRHGVSCRGAAAASGASEAWAPLIDMPYSGLSGRDFFRIQILDLSRAGDLLLTW